MVKAAALHSSHHKARRRTPRMVATNVSDFQSSSRSIVSTGKVNSAIWPLSVYRKYDYGPRNHAAHAKIFRNFVSNSLRSFVMAL